MKSLSQKVHPIAASRSDEAVAQCNVPEGFCRDEIVQCPGVKPRPLWPQSKACMFQDQVRVLGPGHVLHRKGDGPGEAVPESTYWLNARVWRMILRSHDFLQDPTSAVIFVEQGLEVLIQRL